MKISPQPPELPAALLALARSRQGESNPLWSPGKLQTVTYMPIHCPGCPEGCWSLEILLISESSCQTEVSQTLSYRSAWHAEGLFSLYQRDRVWASKTRVGDLFEAGDLDQAVAKGSPRCFWHSGERRGNTLVRSRLEMPNKSLLRLRWWTASWERAVQMLYWIFKEQFFIGAEIWERTECSKSLKMNRATAFTGLWVAKKVYLIMRKRPEHSPGYREGINPINKIKHGLKKKY